MRPDTSLVRDIYIYFLRSEVKQSARESRVDSDSCPAYFVSILNLYNPKLFSKKGVVFVHNSQYTEIDQVNFIHNQSTTKRGNQYGLEKSD